eukprot:778336-Alexandrium_andersonii.AAC.1
MPEDDVAEGNFPRISIPADVTPEALERLTQDCSLLEGRALRAEGMVQAIVDAWTARGLRRLAAAQTFWGHLPAQWREILTPPIGVRTAQPPRAT